MLQVYMKLYHKHKFKVIARVEKAVLCVFHMIVQTYKQRSISKEPMVSKY